MPNDLVIQLQGKRRQCNIRCMSYYLSNVSTQHNPGVPFGVTLLVQRMQYFIDIYK